MPLGRNEISSGGALRYRKSLVNDYPTVNYYLYELSISYSNIATLSSEAGRTGDALEAFNAALTIRDRLARENPAVTAYQHSLAGTHNSIADLLAATGEPDLALKSYKAAIAIRAAVGARESSPCQVPGGAAPRNLRELRAGATRHAP